MTNSINHYSPADLDSLRIAIEKYIDRRIVTPADFDFLADAVRSSVRQSVSATTLKRLWGYINDTGREYRPGRYTLCTLARFIGFRDFEDFLNGTPAREIQSREFFGDILDSSSLPEGALIEISWSPGRVCTLRHIQENSFTVVSSVNSKLRADDIVNCESIVQLAPLFFSSVRRANEPPMTYIAGARTGIRYRLVTDDRLIP